MVLSIMVEKFTNTPTIDILDNIKTDSVGERVTSLEGQEKITQFIENLRNEVGSKDKWQKTCELADQEIDSDPFDNEKFSEILNRFKPYIDEMPPGHDPGHFYRDVVTSSFLFDSIQEISAYKSDAVAGLIGGSFHDIGTSIIPRYQDNKFGAGHAETGAFLFWKLSEGVLKENTRKLAAYSIAAHTNYLKPIEVNIPPKYTKDVYWGEVWEKDQKLCGVGPQLTRCSDRLDTNGITLVMRHIISKFDSIQEGGQDLSGDEWVEINQDSLNQILNPVVRDPIPKPPTTLEHLLTYARSNDGKNAYSKNDYLFPKFQETLSYKLSQIGGLLDSINHPEEFDLSKNDNLSNIKSIFKRVSLSSDKKFSTAWENFESLWSGLPDDDKQKWLSGFKYIDRAYTNLLDYYQKQGENSTFKSVSKTVIEQLKS